MPLRNNRLTLPKTLREELRKVQSSAALLERQRNPGVGYWASRQDLNGDKSPRSSIDGRDSPSRPSSPALSQSDEEINVEYLRNVILQFLEHKEMRVSSQDPFNVLTHFCFAASPRAHFVHHFEIYAAGD